MHSLTEIETANTMSRHLIQIMTQAFDADMLQSADWSEESARQNFRDLLHKRADLTLDARRILNIFARDKINSDTVSAFWCLLLVKRFDPILFAGKICPNLNQIHEDAIRETDLLASIFHGAVSADSVPVRLSQEEISQIEPLNQIPVIFASTLDLQAHVNQLISPRRQFKLMDHEEIPLNGPLQLGRELNIVMTDPAHVPNVRAFILKHRIQGIALFSFRAVSEQLRTPFRFPPRFKRESLEGPMPQPPLASPVNHAAEASSAAAAEETAPAADDSLARGQKRQARTALEEPENKRPRPISEQEETLSSLRVIQQMLRQDGQAAEAEKISAQIKALEDSFAADKSMRPADRKPQPVSKQEEHLSSLYAIHEMLLQEGQAVEAQKIAKQIEEFVNHS